MTNKVHGIGPDAQAALADDHAKRWSSCRAVAALAGMESRRIVAETGIVIYIVGSRQFDTLADVELWLGAEENRP